MAFDRVPLCHLRPGGASTIGRDDLDDPQAAAIVGAALVCLIAAKTTWIVSNHAQPFGDLLDEAMGAIEPA